MFTGAALHLGLMQPGERLKTWPMAFAENRVNRDKAQWAGHDPWGVALKPEVLSGTGPPGDPETTGTETSPDRQDAAA